MGSIELEVGFIKKKNGKKPEKVWAQKLAEFNEQGLTIKV